MICIFSFFLDKTMAMIYLQETILKFLLKTLIYELMTVITFKTIVMEIIRFLIILELFILTRNKIKADFTYKRMMIYAFFSKLLILIKKFLFIYIQKIFTNFTLFIYFKRYIYIINFFWYNFIKIESLNFQILVILL